MEETEAGWGQAEQVVRAHFAKEGSAVRELTRERLPYFFSVLFETPGSLYALVDGDHYVEDKGLGALASYLKHIDARGRRIPVEDMILLLYYFKAWPEPERGSGYYPGLAPYFEVKPNPAFVLAYAQTRGPAHGDVPLVRYTLELTATYQLKWEAVQIYVERPATPGGPMSGITNGERHARMKRRHRALTQHREGQLGLAFDLGAVTQKAAEHRRVRPDGHVLADDTAGHPGARMDLRARADHVQVLADNPFVERETK